MGQSVNVTRQKQHYISVVTGKQAEDIYCVVWHKINEQHLASLGCASHKVKSGKGYHTIQYTGKVYCPTVPGGLIYVKRGDASKGFWCGNSPGITGYLTKNVYKGTDGRLYQKMLNVKTGKT